MQRVLYGSIMSTDLKRLAGEEVTATKAAGFPMVAAKERMV
jgi:hypothetical protein